MTSRLAFALLLAAVAPASARAADARHPTVVELFTAQGCAACVPALAVFNALADRPDILALSFSVTYWDALGWRDSFARPEFTERQRSYGRIGKRQVATPQLILNGIFAIVGNDRAGTDRAIATADRGAAGPEITTAAGTLRIGSDPIHARAATVWLVRYDPDTIWVAIERGENAGRRLAHRNVVRSLEQIGAWRGVARSYRLPRVPQRGLRSAILLQNADGGTIIAASLIS